VKITSELFGKGTATFRPRFPSHEFWTRDGMFEYNPITDEWLTQISETNRDLAAAFAIGHFLDALGPRQISLP
jgi:hypothetical protein